ncbi:META domain-containing protein [Massilia sp. TN1-12]|uniref:META domain-containing protein n=1 Tax=Massilia paldalensis TaxID=3377675 RepID=UPI003851073D
MTNIFSKKILCTSMRQVQHGAGLLLACALAACTTSQGPADAPAALQGSAWRLAGYTPATGNPLAEVRPGQIVFTFGSDGRLSAKLDCNRGTGAYTATPDGPSQGSLRMGPLGVTRMMCPESNAVGAALARDIENLASYRLSGDTLVLRGGQGSGTYVWERVAP